MSSHDHVVKKITNSIRILFVIDEIKRTLLQCGQTNIISNHGQIIVHTTEKQNCFHMHIKHFHKRRKQTNQTIYGIKVDLPKSDVKPKYTHALATLTENSKIYLNLILMSNGTFNIIKNVMNITITFTSIVMIVIIGLIVVTTII